MKRLRMARLSTPGLAVAAGAAVLAALGPAAGTAAAQPDDDWENEGRPASYVCDGATTSLPTYVIGQNDCVPSGGYPTYGAADTLDGPGYGGWWGGSPEYGPVSPVLIGTDAGEQYWCADGFANTPDEVAGVTCRTIS
jgi:hypothetical protein